MEAKKTPLYEKHLQHKARLVNFAGWLLPLEYRSALFEAKATRVSCGIFDVSHMGEIEVAGSASFEFLQEFTSNDISLIGVGQMQYNLFLNEGAGIIDDFMLYRKKEEFFCVVNAVNKDKVFNWLKKHKPLDVAIIDKSRAIGLISLQGPSSAEIISRVFFEKLRDLEYMSFYQDSFDTKDFLISRSGYTGEDGFEVYVSWEDAIFWWEKFLKEGQKYEIVPCGLAARDILRIEAGYPLYGQEIDETINPLQASLSWAVKLNKDFLAKEKIQKLKQEGLRKKRIGFIMKEPGVPRQGYWVYKDQKEIGWVCSGTYSPNREAFIGMAYLDKEYGQPGLEIKVKIRDKLYKAEVVKLPFIAPRTKMKKLANREV